MTDSDKQPLDNPADGAPLADAAGLGRPAGQTAAAAATDGDALADSTADDGAAADDSPTQSAAADTPGGEGGFADLGVDPVIVAALDDADFTRPFPIQHLAIPIALQGSDLIGQARTGTGKTLAFGIPLLQRLSLPGDEGYDPAVRGAPQALVLCPTRELALQVAEDLRIAAARGPAKILTVYGGVGYEPQLDGLSDGVDIVVGTPGRLLDLLGRHNLVLSGVKVLVLDEADEMLDLGFLPDVERLIEKTPTSRQTMLFSATMPSAIVSLARVHLRQPVNIRAEAFDSSITVPETVQFVYQTHDLDKPAIIGKLLQSPAAGRVMVFCKTKRGVQRLTDDLLDRGFAATCIHGDLSQILREKALAKFRDGKAQVIVATDVAARGIDVDQVTHVINYDCPDDEKTYVHRIGRTGRAGRTGIAVTFVDWSDLTRWKLINKALSLPFETPLEAYSTTPQLLEELSIPAGATGRLADPPLRSAAEARPRASGRTRTERGAQGERGRESERPSRSGLAHAAADAGERPRRGRTRRRNGVPVSASAPSDAALEPAAAGVGESAAGRGLSTASGQRSASVENRSAEAGQPNPDGPSNTANGAEPDSGRSIASAVEAIFAAGGSPAETAQTDAVITAANQSSRGGRRRRSGRGGHRSDTPETGGSAPTPDGSAAA
ncbi:MAG: DEAD/DEAH box helicase [Propionibacteriaceae bacterium]|jgi:superfamily II DNA/RNA helicase|nr:DEAD/DEAH box helicase [Propionibacteriaceae bacterium]